MNSPGDSEHDLPTGREAKEPDPAISIADSLTDEEGLDEHQLNAARKVLGLIKRVRQSRESQPDKALVDTDLHWQTTNETLGRSSSGQPGATSADSLKIDRFEIKRQIGKGGYGLVFLAYDYQLDRDVAVKIPRPEVVMDPVLRERFRREARAAAALSHPNIVPVFDSGGEGPVCFIAYAYIDGISLDTWLSNNPEVESRDEKSIGRLMATLAEAVGHAHQRGVLHRDLKPGNILLSVPLDVSADADLNSLLPMITDFGLARIEAEWSDNQTQTGAVIGTPAYMAPEQTRVGKEPIDDRTDIYSLGAVLYELLTGHSPFGGDGVLDVLHQVRNTDPPHPRKSNDRVSGDLAAICLKCLEKSPEHRYQNAWELQEDLRRFAEDRPVSARPTSKFRKFRKWWERNPALATSLSVAMVSIVVGLISVTVLWLRSESLREQLSAREVTLTEHQKDLEAANKELVTKRQQLDATIRGLFLEVAKSREIKSPEAAPLRKKLLERANRFYVTFLDSPESVRDGQGETLYELARVHEYLGDPHGALQLVREAIRQSGETASPLDLIRWHNYAAIRLHQLGRYAEAQQEIQTALQLANDAQQRNPDVAEHAGLWSSQRVFLFTVLADVQNASMDVRGSLETAAAALKLFEEIELNPGFEDDAEYRFRKAVCYRVQGRSFSNLGKYEQAQVALDTAIDLMNQVDSADFTLHTTAQLELGRSWYDKGVTFSRQQDPVSARLCYANALEQIDAMPVTFDLQLTREEEYHRIDYSIAVADMLMRNFEDAESRILASVSPIEKIIRDIPQESASWLDGLGDRFNLLYVIRVRLKKPKADAESAIRRAVDYYEQALVELPDWSESKIALVQAQTNLGNILQRQDRLGEATQQYVAAEENLHELAATHPTWPKVRSCRCNLLQGKMHIAVAAAHLEDALELCRNAQKLLPANRVNHLLLEEAWIHANLQDFESAFDRLQRFREDDSIQPRDFVAAASKAMQIDEYQSDGAATNDFRELAIDLLIRGADEDVDSEQYQAWIKNDERLAEISHHIAK